MARFRAMGTVGGGEGTLGGSVGTLVGSASGAIEDSKILVIVLRATSSYFLMLAKGSAGKFL